MGEIVPVILCGGVGSRLWPLSRKSLPKQFAPLIGTQSLFEAAVNRVDRDEFADPIVVASSDHRFLAEKQMRDFGCSGSSKIEPEHPQSRICFSARNRWSLDVTTIGSANSSRSTRFTAASNRLCVPISGVNCFGRLLRDNGHNRDPTPPHNITGTISLITPLFARILEATG